MVSVCLVLQSLCKQTTELLGLEMGKSLLNADCLLQIVYCRLVSGL